MKKVIAAVAAAFIAPAAFAASDNNVTLYGSLRGFADYVNGDDAGNAFKVKDGGSRIGFMGADKLNSDLSVIWQVESGLNANEAKGNWASRNTFIGLEGSWGTVRLGNFDSAYARMDSTGPQAAKIQNYGPSVDPKDPRGFYGRANTRQKNSISYETANLGGFTARASYGTDANTQNTSNGWIGAVSGTYTVAGLSMGVGYQYAKKHSAFFGSTAGIAHTKVGTINDFSDAGGSKIDAGDAHSQAYKVAVNYQFDKGLNIGAAWEHIEDKMDEKFAPVAGKIHQDTYFIAANYPVGNWLLQGGYGWADKVKGHAGSEKFTADGSKAQMALLGTQYAFSKRSRLYGYVFWVDNDKNANFSTGYDSLGFAAKGADNTGYGVSFGIRTDF